MTKPPTFSDLRDAMKKKVTRRELFLAEMNTVVPWGHLLVLVEPHYPKATSKGGRPLMSLETMLRVYFLQNWHVLSDPMAEETLYNSEAMRRFAGVELGDDRIPDETTILNFRHLLERHGLTEVVFAEASAHLDHLRQDESWWAAIRPDNAQSCRFDNINRQINVSVLDMQLMGEFIYIVAWQSFAYETFVIGVLVRRFAYRAFVS